MASKDDHPELGIAFRLPPVPGASKAFLPKGYGQWARTDREAKLAAGCRSQSFPQSEFQSGQHLRGKPGRISLSRGRMRLSCNYVPVIRAPGLPPSAPYTYGGVKSWNNGMITTMWEPWKRKVMPVAYANDGTVLTESDPGQWTAQMVGQQRQSRRRRPTRPRERHGAGLAGKPPASCTRISSSTAKKRWRKSNPRIGPLRCATGWRRWEISMSCGQRRRLSRSMTASSTAACSPRVIARCIRRSLPTSVT